MRGWKVSSLFVAILLLSGCGTLFQRADSHWPTREYYQGVKYDWNLLTLEGRGGYDPTPMLCYLSIGYPVLTVLVMPVDLVVDTIALPFDYQTISRNDREFKQYLHKTYCNGSEGADLKTLTSLGYDEGFCQSGSAQ